MICMTLGFGKSLCIDNDDNLIIETDKEPPVVIGPSNKKFAEHLIYALDSLKIHMES